jgi:hypothetical protein
VFTYITFICRKKVQKEIEWSKDMVLVKKKMCALLKVTKLGFGGQIIKGVKLENWKIIKVPYYFYLMSLLSIQSQRTRDSWVQQRRARR